MWVLFCSVSFAVLKWFLSTRRVSNYQSKHVFITGCDSGFGNMLAKRLDSMGFVVYAGCLTAVGQQSVRTQCSERTVPVHIDVTSDKSIEKAVEQVKRCLPKDGGEELLHFSMKFIVNHCHSTRTTGLWLKAIENVWKKKKDNLLKSQ